MSLSSIPRGPRTVLVGMGLVALYAGYSQLTSPWLKVEQKQQSATVSTVPHEKSPVFTDLATKWFREDPWVADARRRIRDGGRYLFFNKHELFNDNRSIRVNPVALLWQQKPDEPPITATADSAQLDASTKFSFEEGQFGKITSGLLAGVVRIIGPDGLRIEGHTFHIDDNSMRIWTGQPVNFAWGSHKGVAASGAEIELLSSGDASKEGLMSVSDVQRIRLRGRITCDLVFQEKDSQREPVNLKISAANGFEFFVPTKEATFYGFMDRDLQPDNQILIDRTTATGGLDRLYCSKLVLKLQPRISDDPNAKPSSQLRLASITAEGRRVIFHSPEQNITAYMNSLRYDIEGRMLELVGKMAATTGRTNAVEIHQQGSQLTAARVMIEHDDQNNVHTVDCRGSGAIGPSKRSAKARSAASVDASWTESLLLRRSEDRRVTLRGQAKVTQLSSGIRLSGDVVDMTLAEDVADRDATDPPRQQGGLDVSRLHPKLLVASGHVELAATELTGALREKLTVTFADQATLSDKRTIPPGATADAQAVPVNNVSQSSEMPKSRLSGSTEFSSDTMEASVTIQQIEGKRVAEFSDVWLKGGVNVIHTSVDEKQSFTADGNVLFAKAGFQGNREISLFGDPALVVNAKNRIEGQKIDVDEIGKASVPGSGRIRFVVDVGLDGKPLAKPSPLDIYWGDRMTFSDRTAHFVGNIRAIMNNETDHDVELTCAGLKVHFSDPIQLERSGTNDEFRVVEASSPSPAGEIERIECESRVTIDIDLMKDGVVEAHHHAEFSDLEFNQLTGTFRATGPGQIESTQPDTGKQLTTSPRAVARANIPVKTPEKTFVFIHATFIGQLEGNRNERFVQLKQHVRGVFGPVRQLGDRITIDGLSVDELPEKTGSLGCENLSISAIPGTNAKWNSFSMVAESNSSDSRKGTRTPCRLESQQFSGDADKITYDHAKQQFILRADEGRQARVSYRRDGGEPESLTGRDFKYYRDTNQLTATQITGVQASER